MPNGINTSIMYEKAKLIAEVNRVRMEIMAMERGASFFVPSKDLCIDNGAMIAWLGVLMHNSGIRMKVENSFIDYFL